MRRSTLQIFPARFLVKALKENKKYMVKHFIEMSVSVLFSFPVFEEHHCFMDLKYMSLNELPGLRFQKRKIFFQGVKQIKKRFFYINAKGFQQVTSETRRLRV